MFDKIFNSFRKNNRKFQIINKIILFFLILNLLFILYFFCWVKTININKLYFKISQPTIIYDNFNKEVFRFSNRKCKFVKLSNISNYLKKMVIFLEDKNFFDHIGFDIIGILRAILGKVTFGLIGCGGGSTITQQLVKNIFLSQEQNYIRKIKEIFLSIEIEKKYSKNEILTMYLNSCYFGNEIWGVENASLKYFGINANKLNFNQSLILVGILKSPNINPINNYKKFLKKRNFLLKLMFKKKKINKKKFLIEKNINIKKMLNNKKNIEKINYKFPYYFDSVINEAIYYYKLNEDSLLNKGYKIYTFLDKRYQLILNNIYKNKNFFPINNIIKNNNNDIVQSSSIILDVNNLGVKAIIGGRKYKIYRGFNFAINSKRLPGSLLKPIIVYSTAIEMGYDLKSILKDTIQKDFYIKNYNNIFNGDIYMYKALAYSLNVPTVWLFKQLDFEYILYKANQFGLKLDRDDISPRLSLGLLKNGLSIFDIVSYYSIFANNGIKKGKPCFIKKIFDINNNNIKRKINFKNKRIISRNTARKINSMLLGVFSSGTGINAKPNKYIIAGKTGTVETNFDINKISDQWIVGYTPDIIISTWLGYEKTDEFHFLYKKDVNYLYNIFKNISSNILPFTNKTKFDVSDAFLNKGNNVLKKKQNIIYNLIDIYLNFLDNLLLYIKYIFYLIFIKIKKILGI